MEIVAVQRDNWLGVAVDFGLFFHLLPIITYFLPRFVAVHPLSTPF